MNEAISYRYAETEIPPIHSVVAVRAFEGQLKRRADRDGEKLLRAARSKRTLDVNG